MKNVSFTFTYSQTNFLANPIYMCRNYPRFLVYIIIYVCVCVCVYKYTIRYDGNPLQYSCLENTMDRGAWRATVQ